MKKKIKYLYSLAGIALLSILLLGSCRDDLSTYDVNPIEGVTFDTTGMGLIVAFQFDELTIEPKISTRLDPARLTYEWKINPVPGKLWDFSLGELPFEVIGTEKNLTYEISFPPTAGFERRQLHELVLTVTDTETGLAYIQPYPLSIRNSIGEGLVIAETYDGQTTDISHIMSPAVTKFYNDVSVKHKIFSGVNGYTLPGLIKEIKYSRLRTIGDVMIGITDNSIQTMRTLDYVHQVVDEELFFTPPAVIRPQTIEVFKGGTTFHATLVNDGRTYTDIIGNSGKFALPDDYSFRASAHIAVNRSTSYNYYLNFFDENIGSFIYKQGANAWNDRALYQMSAATTPFNPRGLIGKKVVAADFKENHDFVHVLKDNTGNGIGVYIISADTYGVPPAPKRYLDISNAPEIAAAEHFAILPDQDVIFYATKSKIYAIMYTAEAHSYALRYTVPAGEEITTLQLFQQADYANNGFGPDQYISTNNRQLIVSTYNGSEGRVYLLPFGTPGLAIIDEANITKYEGFGRVTAIGTQL